MPPRPKDRCFSLARRRAVLFALACAAVALSARCAPAADIYRWVQFGAGGLEARAIAQGGECPRATIDGREAAMEPRARPDDAFAIIVCRTQIPKGAREAAIGGRPLALPPPRANRILVIGDTGCRLKIISFQDCNDEKAWPFRLEAEAAAALRPDIVVHVGDYYYRESPCPPLRAGCAGSPHGDNWASWKADFFEPGAALLNAAPFVFVRGNHESCERGWRGWTRLLSAWPPEADGRCLVREPPLTVDIGGPTLVVLDVTTAEDRIADLAQAPIFETQLQTAKAIDGPVWYAFHKPVFASIRIEGEATIGDNKTLVEAARKGLPPNVRMILSGHLHTFQAMSYADDYPAQFVVGNGGDMLDAFAPRAFDGLRINGVRVAIGRGVPVAFGFAMFERVEGAEDEWRVTAHGARGETLARCLASGRKIACE